MIHQVNIEFMKLGEIAIRCYNTR